MSIKNIFLTISAVVAFGSFAMAQGGVPNQSAREGGMKRPGGERMRGEHGRGIHGRGGEMRGEMMDFGKLNLTDAQKQKIQAIQESAKNSREANKSQFEEFGNLMRLKREGLLTTEQGTRLNALQVQMQTQMRANMEKIHNDILAVLTPDQKTLLEQDRNREGGREKRGIMPGQRGFRPPKSGGMGAPT
ncbi:MAG: Spy/CpxP family protein refolding chaperone, partial [Pyrinomonadaceae bacterium]